MSIKYKGQTVSGGGSTIPSGGTTDQVLAKASDADGDIKWAYVESGGEFYSTEETRIGTFFDKPLYRKTFFATLPSIQSGGSVEILEYDSNVEKVVRLNGTLDDNGQEVSIPQALNSESTNQYYCGLFYNTASTSPPNSLRASVGSAYYGKSAIIVMEYTKTTD